jgi:hypothetical protein
MQAESTTETGLNIILRPGVPLGISRTEGSQEAGRARRSDSGSRLARRLETAVVVVGIFAAALGIGLVAYGATLVLTGQDATPRPYPNSQHISTTPNPRR